MAEAANKRIDADLEALVRGRLFNPDCVNTGWQEENLGFILNASGLRRYRRDDEDGEPTDGQQKSKFVVAQEELLISGASANIV